MGGFTWGAYVSEAKAVDLILRPPGAIKEADFMKACIKCGACVEACPYDTLVLAMPGDNKPVGTPHFEPRKVPCEMCPDIPCVPVCPSGALNEESVTSFDEKENKNVLDINKAKMGIAVIDAKSCVAFWGIQCDLCYRACPLMDEAISLKYEKNERTGKHAYLKPVINQDICTGCGLCAAVCPGLAIFILRYDHDEVNGTATFPYEFLPLPEKGSTIAGTDRHGKSICSVKVLRVISSPTFRKTNLVTVLVPKEYLDIIRSIERMNGIK